MNLIKYLLIISSLLVAFFIACDNNEIGQLSTETKMPTRWIVSVSLADTVISTPFKINIYEISSYKGDSIIINDIESKFWGFQVKAAFNNKNKMFQTNNSNCQISDESIGIKIMNGQIINSDSIYFEIKFEDDETPFKETYKISGRKDI